MSIYVQNVGALLARGQSLNAPIFLCLILDLFKLADYHQTEIIMVSNKTQIFIGLEFENKDLKLLYLLHYCRITFNIQKH